MRKPELSVVIPILNEAAELTELLADLQRQQDVGFELLMVDGGSEDGGPAWLHTHFEETGLTGSVLTSPRGRGRQLHHGAQQAKGEWLLFLHADSRFADPLAFRKALELLQKTASDKLAGHFALRFRRTEDAPSVGYYYYEWKARLGRPETIHGDQGFLLRRKFYLQLGGFREDLPVMEDTDFAERLREVGQWQLLPAEISTSARRFETEGLWQRQLLGSLIMCFRSIGYDQFFLSAPEIYRQQQNTEKLRLCPYFELIHKLFTEMGPKTAWQIWWQSGCYVRRHAWQLTFALDARRAFDRRLHVGQGRMALTETFEPIYDLLTNNIAGRCAATALLRLWFVVTRLWLRNKEAETQGS